MNMNIQEIVEYLPHRYPFLLVDRVIDLEPGKHCTAIKNVTINEPFFEGHFPGAPTMPGVLIMESLAQTGALILLTMEGHDDKFLYLAGADKFRFKRPVSPGDVLVNEVRLLWHRRGMGRITCRATVDEALVAEGELSYSLTSRVR